jgi:TPR repeat protein
MFRMVDLPPQPGPPAPPPEPGRCPQCLFDLSRLPKAAQFCPRCGYDRHPLAGVADAFSQPRVIDWNEELARLDRPPLLVDNAEAHSVILSGYAAAMGNLAVRYEAGLGAQKNEDEAIRCYVKAARMGDEHARDRLAAKGIEVKGQDA